MLPKKNRVVSSEVDKVFKGGKVYNSTNLSFRFIILDRNQNLLTKDKEHNYSLKDSLIPKISVIVPKTVAKLAVTRNSLRRRGYDALKKYISQFPTGVIGVLVFKKSINSVLEVENEIKNILEKF